MKNSSLCTTWALLLLLSRRCCCCFLDQEDVGCFVPREETSAGECLLTCQESENCQYFTFYSTEGICLMDATCPEVSTDGCSDCVVGEASCPLCHVPGSCVGTLVRWWDRLTNCQTNGLSKSTDFLWTIFKLLTNKSRVRYTNIRGKALSPQWWSRRT